MKRIDSRVLFDSSAWISYFLEANEDVNEISKEAGIIFTSILSIFEIKRALIRRNISAEMINKSLAFILHKSVIVDLDLEIAEKAVDISVNGKLAAIDSLIYATATMHDAILITGDQDFKSLESVHILKT